MRDKSTRFAVTFKVFGLFTHGKKEGMVDTKSFAMMTFFGKTVKDAQQKFRAQTDNAAASIESIDDSWRIA